MHVPMWWLAILCMDMQYHILREKGTEPPGSGKYNKFYEQVGETNLIVSAGAMRPLSSCLFRTILPISFSHSDE